MGIIELNGLEVRLGNRIVLDGLTGDLRGRSIGLLGPNGAGKSTLIRILAGVYRPDGGNLFLDGKPLSLESPRAANAHGIGIVFQEQSLLPNLTVA